MKRQNRYERYIASPEWDAKRAEVLKRASGICEECRHRKATQVHHLTYKNLGDEPLHDLQAVCVSCHASHHPDKLDGRFIPTVEIECRMCPNDMVEVFWEGRTCRTFCPSCGDTTTTTHPKPPKKKRQKVRPSREKMMRDANADKYRKRRRSRMKTLKTVGLILALGLVGCGSPTAPAPSALEYKEGANCQTVEVEKPRRGQPATKYVRCRPVRDHGSA